MESNKATLFSLLLGAMLEVDFKRLFKCIQGFQAQIVNTHSFSLKAIVCSVGHYFCRGHAHASKLHQNNQMAVPAICQSVHFLSQLI